jgi:peptidoglycan hydrolase-like protein with peptidoglycan-binding domain
LLSEIAMVRGTVPLALLCCVMGALVAGTAPAADAGQASGAGAKATKDVAVGDPPELDDASPRDLVSDAQRLLRLRGFDPGPLDGAVGLRTREAIRAYQAAARAQGVLEAMRRPAPGQARPVQPAAGPAPAAVAPPAAAGSE